MSSREARFSTSEQVPFLEEWKAKRERMRLKSSSSSYTGASEVRSPDPYSSKESKGPMSSNPSQAPVQIQARKLHKMPEPSHGAKNMSEPHQGGMLSGEMENMKYESAPSHGKEKMGSSQRKTRTQIEKRKLREKRRPTGVANISLESFEDAADRESVSARDPMEPSHRTTESQDMTRTTYSRQKSGSGVSTHPPLSRKLSGNQPKSSSLQDAELRRDTTNDQKAAHLERKMNELQQAISGEKMENQKLNQRLEEKEGSIQKLKLQMGSLRQDLNGAEDENRRLRDEHQTLLRVVGQLSG
ncbi:PRKC apoptosis WT1 regulator protein-like [Ambystoma mexicanum]|uniref:PRKC apoptosis WT1 regulator protein-like n=1 Tax=Ambystoma mexicanum TaxID=8296 RepID=UPI0037E826A3